MKCKLLGVFQICGYKMYVKSGLACALASWLLGRYSEKEQMQTLWSHHSMGCHAHICPLALLLTVHLLCPYLMMLNHGVHLITWFWLICWANTHGGGSLQYLFPCCSAQVTRAVATRWLWMLQGCQSRAGWRLPDCLNTVSCTAWQMMLAGSLVWLQYYR